MTDPISDLLTRIRNAQRAGKIEVNAPASKVKAALAEVMKKEGYIEDYVVVERDGRSLLNIRLKYYQGQPVISMMRRVSRPGLRQFRRKDDLPKVMGGLGVAIVSTSKGIMSDREARAAGHGGEVICLIA
jgi:small subunit ribosomal protein S8